MNRTEDHAVIEQIHSRLNASRNEPQKSILLIEVSRPLCATSALLRERTRRLLADTAVMYRRIADSRKQVQ